MISPQDRRLKLQEVDQQIQDLYDSPQANALTEEMCAKHGIPSDTREKYLIVTGDVILGFYKIADLPRLLQTEVGTTSDVAQKITADLIDAWAPIVEREAAEAGAKKEELATLADKIAAIRPAEVSVSDLNFLSEDASVQPKPTEPPLVKPIRTMQTDIGKVHGYGALPQQQAQSEEGIVKATSQDEIRPTK